MKYENLAVSCFTLLLAVVAARAVMTLLLTWKFKSEDALFAKLTLGVTVAICCIISATATLAIVQNLEGGQVENPLFLGLVVFITVFLIAYIEAIRAKELKD